MRQILKNIFTLPAVALTLFVSGCGKEEAAVQGNFPADGVIRVSTEIGAMTRGSYTTDNLKEFDLVVGNNPSLGQTVDTKYCYKNTKFTLMNGVWTPAETMLWQNSTSLVTLLAVAPCLPERESKSVSDFVNGVIWPMKVDQTADDTSADLLGWATPYNFTPKGLVDENGDLVLDESGKPQGGLVDGKVKIRFTHLLSKLTVVFKLGTEFNHDGIPSRNIVSGVEVDNTWLEAIVCLSSYNEQPISAFGNDEGECGSVRPYFTKWTPAGDKNSSCLSEYECLLAPSATARPESVEIKFRVNGIPYKFVTSVKFESGKAYTLTIKAGKDEVVTGTITAAAWDEQEGGTLETE